MDHCDHSYSELDRQEGLIRMDLDQILVYLVCDRRVWKKNLLKKIAGPQIQNIDFSWKSGGGSKFRTVTC